MTVVVAGKIELGKNAPAPQRRILFTFLLKSPLDTENGKIEFTINGEK